MGGSVHIYGHLVLYGLIHYHWTLLYKVCEDVDVRVSTLRITGTLCNYLGTCCCCGTSAVAGTGAVLFSFWYWCW